MTKEQEEIIKEIKIYIHDYTMESFDDDGYTRYEISEEEQEFFNNIDTVLSMLIETVLSMLKEKDKEIEKKDKIIDLMSKWLYEDDTSFGYDKLKDVNTSEKIKQYFERKVKDGN